MDDELAEFLQPGLGLEVAREGDSFVGRLEAKQLLAKPQRIDRIDRCQLRFQ